MQIICEAVGYVRSQQHYGSGKENFWGSETSVIELTDQFTSEALVGLSEFSHIEVLFHFDKLPIEAIHKGARHPRGNPDWPQVGIFAQRAKARPNRIGATICRLLRVNGMSLTVENLDAFDGTPVLDLKPVLTKFIPNKTDIVEPLWAHELMRDYFASKTSSNSNKINHKTSLPTQKS